jgi:hypothetical protein
MENFSITKLLKSILSWAYNQIFFIIGYALISYSIFCGAIIFAIKELILGILFILIGSYVRKVEREDREKAE